MWLVKFPTRRFRDTLNHESERSRVDTTRGRDSDGGRFGSERDGWDVPPHSEEVSELPPTGTGSLCSITIGSEPSISREVPTPEVGVTMAVERREYQSLVRSSPSKESRIISFFPFIS